MSKGTPLRRSGLKLQWETLRLLGKLEKALTGTDDLHGLFRPTFEGFKKMLDSSS